MYSPPPPAPLYPVLTHPKRQDCFQLSDSDLVPINDLIIRNRCTVYGRDGAVLYGLVVERKGAARISQLMHRREQPPFMFYAEDLRTVLNRHGLSEFSSVVETIRVSLGGVLREEERGGGTTRQCAVEQEKTHGELPIPLLLSKLLPIALRPFIKSSSIV